MARAITTRYVGPTNTRAAYVCASEPEGKRVRVPEGPGLGYSEEQWHLQAAMLLCAKLNWSGELIGKNAEDLKKRAIAYGEWQGIEIIIRLIEDGTLGYGD